MKSICKRNKYGKYWYNYFTRELHRKDGPAVEQKDGYKAWFINGKRHREDGPAVEDCDGLKWWFINGILHREDGPAKEWRNGHIFWFLNGKWIITPTFEMMEKYIRLNPDNISKNYKYPLKIQKLAISLKPSIIFSIKYPDPKLKELYPQLFALKKSSLI